VVTRFPDFLWDIEHNSPSLKMQPHTLVALGFTTGLEVLCSGAAHVQPGAQRPASAAAAYNTPLTTLRGAGRMPDREDGTSDTDDDGDGLPSVRGKACD
jgi:hypothetical protein